MCIRDRYRTYYSLYFNSFCLLTIQILPVRIYGVASFHFCFSACGVSDFFQFESQNTKIRLTSVRVMLVLLTANLRRCKSYPKCNCCICRLWIIVVVIFYLSVCLLFLLRWDVLLCSCSCMYFDYLNIVFDLVFEIKII